MNAVNRLSIMIPPCFLRILWKCIQIRVVCCSDGYINKKDYLMADFQIRYYICLTIIDTVPLDKQENTQRT